MTVAGIVIGLTLLALALVIQRIALVSRARKLRAREISFRFHEVRDSLQLLAADRRIEATSLTYTSLMSMTNLAIRNCATMELRHLLQLASKVDEAVTKQALEEIGRQDEEIQGLASLFFLAFAEMLVNNDRFVRFGVRMAQGFQHTWTALKPIVTLVDRVASALIDRVSPDRAEAVRKARRYLHNSDQLAATT